MAVGRHVRLDSIGYATKALCRSPLSVADGREIFRHNGFPRSLYWRRVHCNGVVRMENHTPPTKCWPFDTRGDEKDEQRSAAHSNCSRKNAVSVLVLQ